MASVTTFKELLDRYRRGERDFIGSDLDIDPDNDLSGVCLDGVDLSKSWIVAKFRGASLRGAKFCESNVKTCDFGNADVSGADFSGAALCAAVFTGTRIDNARFEGAFCYGYEFKAGEVPDW